MIRAQIAACIKNNIKKITQIQCAVASTKEINTAYKCYGIEINNKQSYGVIEGNLGTAKFTTSITKYMKGEYGDLDIKDNHKRLVGLIEDAKEMKKQKEEEDAAKEEEEQKQKSPQITHHARSRYTFISLFFSLFEHQ